MRIAARVPWVLFAVLAACTAPAPTAEPASSESLPSGPVQTGVMEREGRPPIPFEFRIPEGINLVAMDSPEAEGEATGLVALAAPRSIGYYEGEVGVMVADVTEATTHKSSLDPIWPPPIGSDAASFIGALDDALGLAVGDITAFDLGGLPAFTAEVAAAPPQDQVRTNHIDVRIERGGTTGSVSFHYPSRVIVADVGGSIVLIQIWAATEPDLEAWMSIGLEIAESIRFSAAQQ